MAYFIVNEKMSQVSFVNGTLIVQDTITKKYTDTISTKCILVAQYSEQPQGLRIHYIVSATQNRLRINVCNIEGDQDSCISLAQSIKTALNELHRPKNLLVFVNPKSGKKNAMKLFAKKVAPLFQLSGITWKLIVTKKPRHPKEVLANYDVSTIQGIVSVGGDGTFSDCVNGLLRRIQSDFQVDINDSDVPIIASKIPLGIVPAGSGNYMAKYMHGTTDLETAVLKIVLGDHIMTNVVGLYQKQELMCYASLLTEFGLIGSMMHDCEKFRWMGQTRYSIIPLASLMQRELVDVEIEYRPAEDNIINYVRQASMPAECTSKTRLFKRRKSSQENTKTGAKTGWKKMEGRVYSVDTYVVTQVEKDKKSVVPRFAEQALTMWVTDKCSLNDHLKQLTKLQKAEAGYLDYDFIRKVRTTSYRVKINNTPTSIDANGSQRLEKKFYINVDGEIVHLTTPKFDVRLHPSSISIFRKCVYDT